MSIGLGKNNIANNTVFGYRSLFNNTTGGTNTAIGYGSLFSNTTGSNNTTMGYNSLTSNTTGYQNTAIGMQALYNNTIGFQNTAIGPVALLSNIIGSRNTAIGHGSLNSNTTSDNTAYGAYSMQKTSSGTKNTGIGGAALQNNITGQNNTALGYSALIVNIDGSNNTAIGYNAGPPTGNTGLSNTTCIGNGATVLFSNTIKLGNNDITTLYCNTTTITSSSDARDKINFQDLDAGLNFVNQLKPLRYEWNRRDGCGEKGRKDIGFTAQDLLKVQEITGINIPYLVDTHDEENLMVGYSILIPILVNAIKELKKENDDIFDKYNILINRLNNANIP